MDDGGVQTQLAGGARRVTTRDGTACGGVDELAAVRSDDALLGPVAAVDAAAIVTAGVVLAARLAGVPARFGAHARARLDWAAERELRKALLRATAAFAIAPAGLARADAGLGRGIVDGAPRARRGAAVARGRAGHRGRAAVRDVLEAALLAEATARSAAIVVTGAEIASARSVVGDADLIDAAAAGAARLAGAATLPLVAAVAISGRGIVATAGAAVAGGVGASIAASGVGSVAGTCVGAAVGRRSVVIGSTCDCREREEHRRE